MISLEYIDIISWLMIALSFVFICVYKIAAPYGKYSREIIVGYSVRPRVAWTIQESPSFIIPLFSFVFYYWSGEIHFSYTSPNLILLICFGLHYFHRSFIYGLKINSPKEVPVEIFVSAFCFCSINGFLQSQYLLSARFHDGWSYQSNFWIGLLLFFTGMAINIHSDHLLLDLRSRDQSYKIPQGGLFEYVSAANYFGEIVEWSGFSLASLSLPSLAFFILAASNMAPRAKKHHEWYMKQFEDFPKDRKCLIPFIW